MKSSSASIPIALKQLRKGTTQQKKMWRSVARTKTGLARNGFKISPTPPAALGKAFNPMLCYVRGRSSYVGKGYRPRLLLLFQRLFFIQLLLLILLWHLLL